MGLKHNFPKVVETERDPGLTDGSLEGIIVGTLWVNTLSDKYFVCVDDTVSNAQWVISTTDIDLTGLGGSSIVTTASSIELSGDEATPGNFQYYGTDEFGNKGYHTMGNLAATQLEIIAASTNLYRILLLDTPYTLCHYNVFGQEQPGVWSTGNPVVFSQETFSYMAQTGSVINTGNIIVNGENTNSFYFYVETDLVHISEYSINGVDWTEFDHRERIELAAPSTVLHLRTTFQSVGEVKSYGILHKEEEGVYYTFIESSFDITFIQEVQTPVAPQSVFDMSSMTYGASGQNLGVYRNGLHYNRFNYEEWDNDTIVMGTSASPLPVDAGDRMMFEINKDDEGDTIDFIDDITYATEGQISFVLPIDFVPSGNEINVYVQGVRQYKSAYNEYAGNEIVFTEPLAAGDMVYVKIYQVDGANVSQDMTEMTSANGQTAFILPFEYETDGQHLKVFINGVRQYSDAFIELNTNSINFTEGLFFGDKVLCTVMKY